MKKEDLKNEGIIEAAAEEVEEVVEESKFKRFVSKAGAGIKKHGKKVVGVAALAAVGAIGYALGHKQGEDESLYLFDGDDEAEVIDVQESDVEVTEE